MSEPSEPDETTPDLSPDLSLDLSLEEETRVRALLAEARHTEPLPAPVAQRLDDVLAALAAERTPADAPADPPADLSAHRRRRNAGRLLLAAAAVIVAGVGISQLVSGGDDPGSSESSAGGLAPDRDSASAESGTAQPAPQATNGLDSGSASAPSGAPSAGTLTPLQLSSDDLEAGLEAELPTTLPTGSSTLAEQPGFTCASPPPATEAGQRVAAYVDGQPATVLLETGTDGRRTARIVACATGTTTATVDLGQR